VAEHQPLVASAASVHAHGDVAALAGDQRVDDIGFGIGVANAPQYFAAQDLIIGRMCGSDLAGGEDHTVLSHALHSDAAVAVVAEAVGDDGVGDLVTDLVRVPG